MGFMTGNGNIARLRSGASVERRKIIASTVGCRGHTLTLELL